MQFAAPGQRHGEFYQDRAAHSGEDTSGLARSADRQAAPGNVGRSVHRHPARRPLHDRGLRLGVRYSALSGPLMSTALTRTPVLPIVPGAPPPGTAPGLTADTAEQVSFKTWVAVIGSTVGAFLAI